MDGLILLLVPIVALSLWGLISPRSQWRVLASWSYRDPAANEPSDAAYLGTRLVNLVIIGCLVWATVGLANLEKPGARAGATTTPTPTVEATSLAPVSTMAAVGGKELRAAFGVDEASIVRPPVSAQPPDSVPTVSVRRWQKADPGDPPAYLSNALGGQSGTWLVLGVRADAPPVGVKVDEVGFEWVSVEVHAPCSESCRTGSAGDYFLVPVQVQVQRIALNDGAVFDGTRRVAP
ncbi:hypothetical protein [Actinoplanes couchii]|uniref:hypothetical protein n=1 Tax=Actinoplanes couchii TaxID=403638 RepID=UPI0019417747|nr:hypothetical protein [Actinoplanes couchii]MDR6319019.1 hypothetical protein [Actinoplanes couchii]